MNTKHTPGPWVVEFNDNDRSPFGNYIICNRRKENERADQWGICTLWPQSGGAHDGSEDAGNAKLIAAAPELAEALQECVAAYVAVDHANTYTSDDVLSIVKANERIRAAQTKARAALAKAGLFD